MIQSEEKKRYHVREKTEERPMALFYVKNDLPFIPAQINPQLVKLAKAIVKTCRLSFKHQLKTTGVNNAMKSGDVGQMHAIMQKVLEKNRKLYDEEMALSGAAVGEVDDAFFADKDADFYKNQMQVLIDFAYISCVIEARVFPLMAAACEKTLGKPISELLFFTNQNESEETECEETEAEEAEAEEAEAASEND